MPSNAGFRPEELNRRAFQRAAALTIDKQAHAITVTREFLATLSARLDQADARLSAFEQRSWRARLRWLLRGK